MNLLDQIHNYVDDDDETLQVQCERFLDSMNEDDQGGDDVDFAASHLGAFNAIFSKVSYDDFCVKIPKIISLHFLIAQTFLHLFYNNSFHYVCYFRFVTLHKLKPS